MVETSRRSLLFGATCCALPLTGIRSGLTLAAGSSDMRVVVILLRGAMDAFGFVQPYGDQEFRALRPTIAMTETNGLLDLDGFFGLAVQHEKSRKTLFDLWQREELGFVQAVSTPYRGNRSHFDGQDLLETGGKSLDSFSDGWLNRLVRHMGNVDAVTVSPNAMLLGSGSQPLPNWSPGTWLNAREVSTEMLLRLYETDSSMLAAVVEAMELDDLNTESEVEPSRIYLRNARFAAKALNQEARIAAFSIGGWDTHISQAQSQSAPVDALARCLAELRSGLGDNWQNTAVIAVSEFGRTAHENGSAGTDHGTGGMAVFSGGAIRGGRVMGEWPGLASGDLYEGRDIRPTADVRAYIAALFAQMMDVEKSALEQKVFGDLSIGAVPTLLR